jgi:membrane-associated phospholipid phosphatase
VFSFPTVRHLSLEANTILSMPQDRPNRRWFLLPAGLVLAAAAALTVDVPIAQTIRQWQQSPAIHPNLWCFGMFEAFGHGLGVIVLVLALHQLDPGHRWAIPRVLVCAFAAGGADDLVKMLILRTRPQDCLLDGGVWSTFGQWFPGVCLSGAGQSFPSAHTATAAGFALALTWLYPQGRILFSVLVVLLGCQRMISESHYLSDVLIGAAIGCVVAQLLLRVGPLPVWFSGWEERWRSK